ncbi:hypothetical protein GSH19_00320 [Lactobacillus sp. S2-2]|uniref:hypothetical protein n=1 Tax=Lactobacillus sp. S2-2 TaxID=2692917 RepID=UPI001F4007A3|nr:hypothetical protein [Lactobacillus sp. S2-2]MCF6514630.1 hypothetical protein [Lactobacillus sp. S2-2]
MRHIITSDNSASFKNIIANSINESTNQFDFDMIRPIPAPIRNAVVNSDIANAAIGAYMINLDFNRDDIPSTVEALAMDLNQDADDFFDSLEEIQQTFLETFNEVYSQFSVEMDDSLKEGILQAVRSEENQVKAQLTQDNIDLGVFLSINPDNLSDVLMNSFEDLDIKLMSWLVRQGKLLIDNYIAFQAFNQVDWLKENWKIDDRAFNTEVDKKENRIVFETSNIVGLTDLVNSLIETSGVDKEDIHYSYEI